MAGYSIDVSHEIHETRPPGTVSIDVDPLDAHLAGYGVPDAPPDLLVYERAIPRILERLAEHSIRATFFWVARDSAARAQQLREIVAAGHEVASHTVSHPEAWRLLPQLEVARELRDSKDRLEQAAGAPVVGFRSPGWHGPLGLAEALRVAGYRYDASVFPSPLLGAAAALIFARSGGKRRTALGARWWFARRNPHALANGLYEFPLSVTRRLRIPVYHTLRYGLGDVRFARALDGFCRAGHALSYPIHAVDALGAAEDGVDPRLASHPGMGVALEKKLALISATFRAIADRFASRPFCERLPSVAAQS